MNSFLKKVQNNYRITASNNMNLECEISDLKGELRTVANDFKHINEIWPEALVFKPSKVSNYIGQDLESDEIILYLNTKD